MNYDDIIARRRVLNIEGYKTLADVGFDGPWVTPYQMASSAPDGLVLVAYNWLDEPSVNKYREILAKLGYLPGIMFNKVMDQALGLCGMRRDQLYMTQAFHLLPSTRSARIPSNDIDTSFDAVTRHELIGRRVVALGSAAAGACRRHGVKFVEARRPSARGLTQDCKANELARLLLFALGA